MLRVHTLRSPRQVTVGHDNSGPSPAWHLAHMRVACAEAGWDCLLPCGQWFDERSGDGAIQRTLLPQEEWVAGGHPAHLHAAARHSHCLPVPSGGPACTRPTAHALTACCPFLPCRQPDGQLCEYRLHITTGSRRGAGTDADVYIALHGAGGSTPVTTLASRPEHFERGRRDTFVVQLPWVDQLHSITIGGQAPVPISDGWATRTCNLPLLNFELPATQPSTTACATATPCPALCPGHNSRGASPDWFLEMVEVEDVAAGHTYFCACSAWLGPREGGGLCERTLPASASDPRPPKKTYQVMARCCGLQCQLKLADPRGWASSAKTATLGASRRQLPLLPLTALSNKAATHSTT